MTTTGPARELTLCEGVLTCGAYLPAATSVVTEPDEAISLLLDGKAVTVTPRIIGYVAQTLQMVLANGGTDV